MPAAAGACQRGCGSHHGGGRPRGALWGPGLALPCRQKASGSSMAGTALPLCLLLAAALQGGLTQAPGPMARPGPLLLRLQRLEEQVGARGREGAQPRGALGVLARLGVGDAAGARRGDVGSPHLAPLPCSFAGSRR